MIDILILLFITAFAIQGWDYSTQYDPQWDDNNPMNKGVYGASNNPFGDYWNNPEIFGLLRFYIGNLLVYLHLKWLAKPLFLCKICGSSIYGSISFWTYYKLFAHHINYPVLVWLAFLFALAGLTRIIRNIMHQ